MKLAHLILAHKNPVMIERLVRRLHHQDADVYIQLDLKANIDDYKHLEAIGHVWFVGNRVKTEWGNYSIIQATINGFQHILQTGIAYSHINLLSGQDYPLKPIEEIQQFLFANTGKTFMHSLSIDDNEWPDGKLRIAKYSLGDYNIPGKYRLNSLLNALLPPRKPPYGLKPYGRSQWLTITPECAQYCIDYIKTKPRLRRFFRMTWAVDEVYFQTILENSPLRHKIVNDNLRYIEQEGPNRPNIFTLADGKKLLASGKLFARKFDTEVDEAIFDYLDKAAMI
jgi:hypothetical protein